jgi:YesN/AraC family two-component response regulator
MVADEFDLTTVYLSRFFKEQTGENFMDYLNNLRLEMAITLFKDENLHISDISNMVGYTNLNSFTRLFKRYKGITPSEFKEQTN